MDAAWTHPRVAVDAKRTQNARVLDAVFDKLFLGSTVCDIGLECANLTERENVSCQVSKIVQF